MEGENKREAIDRQEHSAGEGRRWRGGGIYTGSAVNPRTRALLPGAYTNRRYQRSGETEKRGEGEGALVLGVGECRKPVGEGLKNFDDG